MRAPIVAVLGLFLALAAVGGGHADADAKSRRAKSRQVATDTDVREREREQPKQGKEPVRGQSVGAPWQGKLRNASKLVSGKGYFIRRPHRVFATRTTIQHTKRAIAETRADHPKAHLLAIGDFSEEHGGAISGHASHRSGRDVDLGLFYKQKPKDYPENFVVATAETIDRPATWRLIIALAQTATADGGVQVMFLDYEVQGILYKWAKANGVSTKRLGQLFQYAHGRGQAGGLIRHTPNHADHLHVRYRCAKADGNCR